MLGFIIGLISLVGLVKVLRAGRGACYGGGCGSWQGRGLHGQGWGHHHGGGWHGGDFRRDAARWGGGAFFLRGLFERLDTTPGQEKVIRQAVEEVRASMEGARGEVDQSRREIADAIRRGATDETALGELFARHDEKLRELRKAFVGALAKVNEALDEDQRRRLAEMLDQRGFGGFGGGGPYRGGAWA